LQEAKILILSVVVGQFRVHRREIRRFDLASEKYWTKPTQEVGFAHFLIQN
jgi:hypothetical protein